MNLQKLKPYPKMKDSGIEWIGEIPEHWQLKKLKQIGKLSAGGTPSTGKASYWENGTIPWISSGEVDNNIITDYVTKITELGLKESSTRLFPKGTVLLAITGQGKTRGQTAVLEIDACTNQSVVGIVIDHSKVFNYFLWYYIQSQYWHLRSHSQGSVQSGLNLDILKNYPISICSLDEQHQIVKFLKYEFSKINSEISKNQKLLEFLKEKKQATINQAVTKGLDPSVPMKNSGIDWIGKIPKHWTLRRLGTILDVTKLAGFEYTMHFSYQDIGEISIVKAQNVSMGKFVYDKIQFISKNISENLTRSKLYGNEILMVFIGAGIGNVCLTPKEGKWHLGPNVAKITPKDSHHSSFFCYYLQSKTGFVNTELAVNSTAQPNFSMADIRKFIILVPPLIEKQQISDYLDKQISKIDLIISKIETQIEKLNEFRKSIISLTVTGKINVREVVLN